MSNLKVKRRIDFFLGGLLLLALRTWISWTRFFSEGDPGVTDDSTPKRILVLKFQGGGSLVLAGPALSDLKRSFPEAKIILWGTSGTRQFAEPMGLFDEILTIDEKLSHSTFLQIFRQVVSLRSQRVEWALDLEVYSKLSSVLAYLSGAKKRVGFAVDTAALRKGVHTHLVVFNRYQYLGRSYSNLVRLSVGRDRLVLSPQSEPEFTRGFQDGGKVDSPIDSAKSKVVPEPEFSNANQSWGVSDYVVLNPNAGELSLERRWPLAYFLQLILDLRKAIPQLEILITGFGPAESRFNSDLVAAAASQGVKVVDLCNRLSIRALWQLMDQASVVVSNDSGPLHLALTGRAPVVGLFGPTQPLTYFPTHRTASLAFFFWAAMFAVRSSLGASSVSG